MISRRKSKQLIFCSLKKIIGFYLLMHGTNRKLIKKFSVFAFFLKLKFLKGFQQVNTPSIKVLESRTADGFIQLAVLLSGFKTRRKSN